MTVSRLLAWVLVARPWAVVVLAPEVEVELLEVSVALPVVLPVVVLPVVEAGLEQAV